MPQQCSRSTLPLPKQTHPIENSPSSLVRQVDPLVRALNTVMYGLLVHFGTLWMIDLAQRQQHNDSSYTSAAGEEGRTPSHLLSILFLHEYWVYLQHSNVFGNPLLQHLDRQYGIALLKKNQHWSIAGTLTAYWSRECLCLFLCLPFLQRQYNGEQYYFTSTQYMILYSLIYHTIKSRGVREDALKRSSPRFGIMRLVIDKFYLNSMAEVQVTVLRLFLQGFDTYIHFCVVRDLVLLSSPGGVAWCISSMHVLFTVWVVHAALNQFFRKSTASVMVQTWHALTAKKIDNDAMKTAEKGDFIGGKENATNEDKDESTEGESLSSGNSSLTSSDNKSTTNVVQIIDANDEYVVRQLLHHERVCNSLKGRQGSASSGVDKAIRLATSVSILAAFFMIGINNVPMQWLSSGNIVATSDMCNIFQDQSRVLSVALYSWLLWGLLYGIWAIFLKSRSDSQLSNQSSSSRRRQISFIRMADFTVMIGVAYLLPPESKGMLLFTLIVLTGKSFIQSMDISFPRIVWNGLLAVEFLTKLRILRMLQQSSDTMLTSFVLTVLWSLWVVTNANPTPCEVEKQREVADAVFLGHPAELHDCWALWLRPYSLQERWQAPSWVWPLWPFHYVVGWYVCNYRQRLFGDKASFFCSDTVMYGNALMQNWVATHFARHFVTNPRQVKKNIEAAARHAEEIGVKVLCLGALNKAESINGGGLGIVNELGPRRRISVIHGNHLTSAAVVETIHQVFGDRKVKFFLTGASSKVGWAVAQALRDRHAYEVLCHSTDPGRRRFFREHGFASAATLAEGSAFSKYWIVGKYDTAVAQLIPQNSTAVVFSVPHPLGVRSDVRVIEAGTLHMDLQKLDRPRSFTNKLRAHEIFACHAASAVAAYRLEKGSALIDEVGPVDPQEMDSWLDDAKLLGFQIPTFHPVEDDETIQRPAVVIVGSGPAGLSAAAMLSQKNIPHIVLEAQPGESFGSWSNHFAGLEITTQKKWCNLPGLSMNNKDFPEENVSAEEYQRYLQQYVHRFNINIRRGVKVVSVEKGGSEECPWVVKYEDSSSLGNTQLLPAFSVIVATGKHRVPNKNTTDDVAGKLTTAAIQFVHSTEMCDGATWEQAVTAARNGRLCIVGLGNSAADLAALILQRCPTGEKDTTQIHIAARTVPPVFPRKRFIFRVDSLGFLVRLMPQFLQDFFVHLLWTMIPSSKLCNAAFPSHLKRWTKINGRVPVIDKHGMIASGLQSGKLVGHGPILDITSDRNVHFDDRNGSSTAIDMVILATGYKEECSLVDREDKLNGMYKIGFGKDRFLPLKSIGDEAKEIVEEISKVYDRALHL
ncbi:flavin-binding monooxygenase-like protein [Skeletonema marinoi]|uniref:Flavin-binding monooxygenase-like protein n=1 Tax=Skeletonema marinoi TaxID=267567 RepID=A0AAD9D7I8_9STRA|nr:flavin-binding monooxygenase-like protein [Skeletonema marinoi]